MLPPNLYARVRFCFAHTAHETAGAARTRSSLRPHDWRAGIFRQTSGKTCREIAKSRLRRLGRAKPRPNADIDEFRFALPILQDWA